MEAPPTQRRIVASGGPGMVASSRSVLDEVGRRGIDWQRTRFGRYLKLFEEVERRRSSTDPPRDLKALWSDRTKIRAYYEGANQILQLIFSAKAWLHLDAEILHRKLDLVFDGTDLPPHNPDKEDKARNTLLELTTASVLHNYHFDVRLTEQDEDMIATARGFPYEFVVECKRPAHPKSLEANLLETKSQLGRRRIGGGFRRGMVVLGIDRMVGASGNVGRGRGGGSPDVEGYRRWLNEQSIGAIRDFNTRRHLHPSIPLAAVVFVGLVLPDPKKGTFISHHQLHLIATNESDTTFGRVVEATVQRPGRMTEEE